MKAINEISLAECLDTLRHSDTPLADAYDIAERIHELTRWISVEERMPTIEDADERGNVLWWSLIGEGGGVIWEWDTPAIYGGQIVRTHWKRIDKPEGV